MKKVSIISRVDVNYNETDIIRLITAEIETENPSVQVNSVSLERKINPPRVGVVVDASVRGAAAAEQNEPKAPAEEEVPLVNLEETTTVEDIFGDTSLDTL